MRVYGLTPVYASKSLRFRVIGFVSYTGSVLDAEHLFRVKCSKEG